MKNNTIKTVNIFDYMYLLDKPIIIGLLGDDNIGKSTLAKQISKLIPNTVATPLAKPVKEIAMMFGYKENLKRIEPRQRKLLEEITRIGMKFDRSIWFDKYVEEINYKMMMFGKNVFIINDARYDSISVLLSNKYQYREYIITKENRDTIQDTIIEDVIKMVDEQLRTIRGADMLWDF